MRSDTIGLRAGMTADLSADVAAHRALPAFAITEYNSNTAAYVPPVRNTVVGFRALDHTLDIIEII